MKEGLVNLQRAIVTNDQAAEVSQPCEGAFHCPAPPVSPEGPAVLRGGLPPILAVRGDQLDAAPGQLLAQRVTVVASVRNQAFRLLPRTTGAMPTPYADRLERRLDELDLRRGRRVKVVSQRNTRAVDHHHPLRPLPPLGFADSAAPFFAGAKLPSRKASLQFNCWRSFNSPRNARQISSQTSCSSQFRSRRQQVEGDGNSSGISCQRAPLRRIHKMPSSTLRSFAGGRPPRGRGGRWGSKGRIFSHWASVNNRPYRAIGPPSGAAHFRDPPPQENIYRKFSPLYRVLKWLLAERQELQQRLLCAREAAGQALGRVRSRRLELYEAHRSLLSILLSASERLKQNPEDERAWTALAYRGRELPKVRAELAMLESVPVGDRLALLNASNVDRERLVARMVIHGGVVDSNGKFVEVGDPRTSADDPRKLNVTDQQS